MKINTNITTHNLNFFWIDELKLLVHSCQSLIVYLSLHAIFKIKCFVLGWFFSEPSLAQTIFDKLLTDHPMQEDESRKELCKFVYSRSTSEHPHNLQALRLINGASVKVSPAE